MANVHNSFDLLYWNTDSKVEPASGSNRKRRAKKNKKLASENVEENGDRVDATLPASASLADANSAADGDISTINADQDGFTSVSAGSHARSAKFNSAKDPNASKRPSGKQDANHSVSIGEEILSLEKSATVFSKVSARRLQLWKEWIDQAKSNNLAWKQIFVESQALEITICSCLQPPVKASEKSDLQTLLTTFLADPAMAPMLAQVVVDLSLGLSANGPCESDLLTLAKQALTSAVSALKTGETGWAVDELSSKLADISIQDKLSDLGDKVTDCAKQMDLLQDSFDDIGTLTQRESLSHDLVILTNSRLNLIMPKVAKPATGQPVKGPTAAQHALHYVRRLATQIRDRKLPPVSSSAEVSNVAEVQKQLREVEAEAETVVAQLEAAEKEVERLRDLAATLETKRQVLASQLDAPSRSGGVSSNGRAGSAAGSVQRWCAQQLGVVHALEALLLRPPQQGAGKEHEEIVGEVVCQAVVDHLQALCTRVTLKQQQLQQARERLQFSQDKSSSLEAELQAMRKQGKSQALLKELQKPRDRYLNMIKEWSGNVEKIKQDADHVENSLQSPGFRTAVALLPPHPPVHALLNEISFLLNQMEVDYRNIKSGHIDSANSAVAIDQVRAVKLVNGA